jgi:hypothetical protein
VASGVLERPLAASDTPRNGILFHFQQFSAQFQKEIIKQFLKKKTSTLSKKTKKLADIMAAPLVAACRLGFW